MRAVRPFLRIDKSHEISNIIVLELSVTIENGLNAFMKGSNS